MLGLLVGVAAVAKKLRQAADNLGPAFERPLIPLSRPSAKSATHLAARDSWALCAHHPWQQLPYTITRFCLLLLLVQLPVYAMRNASLRSHYCRIFTRCAVTKYD